MKRKAYRKSIIREILSSKARFASILLIIFLGTAFFSGVRSTSPDMSNASNVYFSELNLMDSRIVSTLGLTEDDLNLLKDNDKILSYAAFRSFDLSLTNLNNVVKFMEYNSEDNENINTLEVVEGRLPEASGEIALDAAVLKNSPDLKLGDTYEVEGDEASLEKFNVKSFTIVGFVNSPLYTEGGNRGTSSVGKGSVDYFAVINSEDINMDAYTEIYVKFKNVDGIDTYSDEYKDLMEENTEYLKELFSGRENSRVEEIKADAESKLQDGIKELEDGEAKLLDAQNQVTEGREQLQNGKAQYEEGLSQYRSKKSEAEVQISQAEAKLTSGQAELNRRKKELERGESALNSVKLQLDNARNALMSSGVNPDNGTAAYEKQLKALEDLESSENSEVKAQIAQLKILISSINSYSSGKAEYEKNLAEINSGKEQIKSAEAEIAEGFREIENSKKALEEAKVKLDESKVQLEEWEKQLTSAQAEIDANSSSLEDGRRTIEEKQEEINKIRGTYYYFDRTDLSGYSGYKDAINSIKNIASFLPLFFFLVAVLICLTTMTRMVEEKRIEIGTLKALGYSNFEIAKKYIIYASAASISGAVLGIIAGCNIFPYIIFNAYSALYHVGKLEIIFYPSYIIQSLVISIACTVGAALVVLRGELSNKPCDLMRAKAPKMGKKILLERITPLWRRLNFNQKVTLRNIFRYKQRMLMTVFGIAGCMAMLVLGFSLKASNDLIVERQFGQLWNYDALVIFNDVDEEESQKYDEMLNSIDGFKGALNVYQESVTLNKEGINKQTAAICLPEDIEGFKDYITLRDRKSKEIYNLDDEGVVINEKLAKLMGVKIGDYIEFSNSDNETFKVKVEHITENYTSHYIYMSPKYYESIFHKDLKFNSQYIKLDTDNTEDVSEEIVDSSKVLSLTLVSDLIKSAEESSESLNLVMVVIILSAGGLAFIVLYNLNNINVSERIRELSTIKVLGFYDNEVTMYILRENVILTILGILAGSVLGKYVYLYILKTAELDNMMMVPEVHLMRYVTAGVLTLFFSVIVMIMMHIKLKKVNMIDALKSVE